MFEKETYITQHLLDKTTHITQLLLDKLCTEAPKHSDRIKIIKKLSKMVNENFYQK